SGVQVGPANEGDDDDVRLALSSEAGLNDGLAFPFVYLAITVAASGVAADALTRWFLVDVLWKIASGVAMGALIGRLTALVIFRFSGLKAVSNSFVALALTLIAY